MDDEDHDDSHGDGDGGGYNSDGHGPGEGYYPDGGYEFASAMADADRLRRRAVSCDLSRN